MRLTQRTVTVITMVIGGLVPAMATAAASAAAPPGRRLNPLAGRPSQGRAASERAESGQGGPELAQDGRRPGRVLEHAPVAEPVEGDRRGAGPRGGLGGRGRVQEGILARDDHQSGNWDGREIRAPQPSDVHRRTVEAEDAISHGAGEVRCQDEGRLLGHPEHLEDTGPLLRRCRQLLSPELLPRLRCLPDLGEVVPLELDVADARGVGDPRSDQLRPGRDHADHEPAAQSCPTRSTGSPRRSSCATSQPAYSSIVAPKPAGRALSNPGSDSATVSGRPSAANRPCQTAGVSGTPWTKTAVMAPYCHGG